MELPFVIPAPLPNNPQGSWFLARSADCERLMIIFTAYGKGAALEEPDEDIPYAANGSTLSLSSAGRVYVFEQDSSWAGPIGEHFWRKVNSLGDNSLFLGLNYPIIDNLMKNRKCQAPDGTLFPFMRKNCVYTAYRWFRGTQRPQIRRYNLQPNEGELVGVISLPKDGWDAVRQAAIWFMPSLDVVGSLLLDS